MFDYVETSVVATTVATIGIIFISLWMKRNRTKNAERRYPPSASALQLLGAILRGGIAILPDYFMKAAKKLGPVISYNITGRLLVVLSGKEAISEVFIRQSEAFSNRSEFWIQKTILNPKLKGIAFPNHDEDYKKHHKLCLSILKDMGFGEKGVSEARIVQAVESLNEEILKLNGQPFDPKSLTASSTFSVISSILFGKTFMSSGNCHKIAEAVSEFVRHLDHAISFVPFLKFFPQFCGKIPAIAQYHEHILNGMEEGIECSKSIESESTFVRRFVEIQGKDYDQQDLLYISRDICLAGSETVSTTMLWALVELANNPEIQNRFQNEIDDVVAEERLPSLDDKPRMPYTEAVILEVMRRHTLVPLYVPRVALKDTEVLGYYISKGSMVFASVISAHMDPNLWTDPENFRPDRFLHKGHTIIGSEEVIGFGIGKRSCLGEILARQEIFLFLTSLVQRFDIRPPEGQNSISVNEVVGATIHPSEFKVRLTPRTKSKD